jgi:uncharacterized protein
MKLLLKNLRNGQIRFEETLSTTELELDPERFGTNVKVRVEVQRGERWIQFHSCLSAGFPAVCDRCAIDFLRSLVPSFTVLAHEGESLPVGTDPEEIHLIRPEDEVLDLGVDFRDELLIASEQPCLCGPDCRGLCAGCGKDLNQESCSCPEPGPSLSPFEVLATRKS